jgi:hypothetical protein
MPSLVAAFAFDPERVMGRQLTIGALYHRGISLSSGLPSRRKAVTEHPDPR